MASRVAIVGANGAGKSTMIKLLTGEMKPTVGSVYKHPNCRFAYVAQHAFHHIEQHLEKSPNEYIRWRYEGGQDKEARAKSTAIITPEEQKIMEKPFEVSWKDEESGSLMKEKRVVEKLMARRKVKKEYHYEVKWKGKTMDFNSWYSRESLIKRGFIKLIKLLDTKLAASQQQGKPLTSRNVEEHLGNVGLESEAATHSRIKDLSGGQKVKVVLAACTWCCPHLIILDEPTNYLDRDSLGALANAIDEFEGGVVLITHNKEFADATTKVTWVVANNKCDIKGDPEWEKYAAEQEILQIEGQDEMFDAAGNKINNKKHAKSVEEMTRQEIKKNKKSIKSKIKRGEELEEYEMDWADEWNIKYEIPE
jgi:elongation factor 3